jgi:cytoskeletal protein CcmA (bactofilin family)
MKKKLPRRTRKIDSFIGKDSTLSGDIFSKRSLCIEGVVEGNVFADGTVLVGKTAYISGSIESHSASISGEVKGSVIAKDYVKLTSTCTVRGDIHAANFITDEGSVFNGNCYMNSGTDEDESGEEE